MVPNKKNLQHFLIFFVPKMLKENSNLQFFANIFSRSKEFMSAFCSSKC